MLFIYKYLHSKKKFKPVDVKKLRLKKFFFQHIRFDIRLLSPKKFHHKRRNIFWDFLSELIESTNSIQWLNCYEQKRR